MVVYTSEAAAKAAEAAEDVKIGKDNSQRKFLDAVAIEKVAAVSH